MENLARRSCVPCRRGTPALASERVAELAALVPRWAVQNNKLCRVYAFSDFASAMGFVNRMASLAEGEGHHPDFCVHDRRVEVSLWTHVAGGLTENDFILAAKLDAMQA